MAIYIDVFVQLVVSTMYSPTDENLELMAPAVYSTLRGYYVGQIQAFVL